MTTKLASAVVAVALTVGAGLTTYGIKDRPLSEVTARTIERPAGAIQPSLDRLAREIFDDSELNVVPV
jgi:hypothetical protein